MNFKINNFLNGQFSVPFSHITYSGGPDILTKLILKSELKNMKDKIITIEIFGDRLNTRSDIIQELVIIRWF